MSTREQKQAAVDALHNVTLTTDLPAALRPYPANCGALSGLRSGAGAADNRTPKQRAAELLRHAHTQP
jgi:hypothetical protein